MARKRKENISEVMFSYVGTDEQFDEFLKMLVHDYLSVDQPYTKLQIFLARQPISLQWVVGEKSFRKSGPLHRFLSSGY